MTDFEINNEDKLLKDLKILKEDVTPQLIKKLNENNIDKKSLVIFFTSIVAELTDDIGERDFSELIFRYYEKLQND